MRRILVKFVVASLLFFALVHLVRGDYLGALARLSLALINNDLNDA